MDPSQPIDESGPVGSFTEAPDDPTSTDVPGGGDAADAAATTAGADDAAEPETSDIAGGSDAVDASDGAGTSDGVGASDGVDLDEIAADLADVERAMERLEAATYWTDEVTGAPLDDEFLADNPTARRAGPATPPPSP